MLRWWDGHRWTQYTHIVTRGGSRLPRWLSIPVVVAAPLVGLLLIFFLVTSPISLLAATVPLVIVLPAMWWLDRIEPEPLAGRVHAVLWGATVAVLVAGVINSVVGYVAGPVAAAVLSAPIVEEAAKGAGLIWAVRRGEIDGVIDGIVFAGWIALGFAVVEDVLYFATAEQFGALGAVFVMRALLTPFVHPLFTMWIGLAVGLEVKRGRALTGRVLWGYLAAVALHMAWNGSLALFGVTDESGEFASTELLVAAGMFVVLFWVVVAVLVMLRQRERRAFESIVPFMSDRYDLTSDERAWFVDWRSMLARRRSLPRARRRDFDEMRGALARLALHHQRGNYDDPDAERVLMQQLDEARRALALSRADRG